MLINQVGIDYSSELTEEERNELLSYIIAANDNANEFLKSIPQVEVRNKVIKTLKANTSSLLSSSLTYEDTMKNLDEKIKAIEALQKNFNEYSVFLEAPKGLNPNEAFTFTLAEIMTPQRADADFFEIVFLNKNYENSKNLNTIFQNNEEKITTTSNTISGVAPINKMMYTYSFKLKYTMYINSEKATEFNASFKLWVGEKPKNGDGESSSFLLNIIIAIFIISVLSLVSIQIYLQCYKAKTFKLKEIIDATQYMDARKVDIKSDINKDSSNDEKTDTQKSQA